MDPYEDLLDQEDQDRQEAPEIIKARIFQLFPNSPSSREAAFLVAFDLMHDDPDLTASEAVTRALKALKGES